MSEIRVNMIDSADLQVSFGGDCIWPLKLFSYCEYQFVAILVSFVIFSRIKSLGRHCIL